MKESTGMLDITFSDKADLPEGMFVKSSVSSDITGNVNSRSRTVDVGDDQDCDRSDYSNSNSDFDEGHSSASEDSESELWQSAYGSMMKFHSMNDERANYEVQNTTNNSQTRQSETGLKDVDEMDKSNGTCGSGELTDTLIPWRIKMFHINWKMTKAKSTNMKTLQRKPREGTRTIRGASKCKMV